MVLLTLYGNEMKYNVCLLPDQIGIYQCYILMTFLSFVSILFPELLYRMLCHTDIQNDVEYGNKRNRDDSLHVVFLCIGKTVLLPALVLYALLNICVT